MHGGGRAKGFRELVKTAKGWIDRRYIDIGGDWLRWLRMRGLRKTISKTKLPDRTDDERSDKISLPLEAFVWSLARLAWLSEGRHDS